MDPNFTCAVLGISDPNGKAIDVGHLILTSPGLSANATTKDHQGLRNRGLRVCLENWGSSVRTTGFFFSKTSRASYKYTWLVVLTILKNMSQWEGLSHIWKIKNL